MTVVDPLEKYGNICLIQISPKNLGFNGPKAFYTLMDELETALKEDEDDGFYNNRTSFLKAYTDGCLYGLTIQPDEENSAKKNDFFQTTPFSW